MGLFSKKQDPDALCTLGGRMGYALTLYPNRVEKKEGFGSTTSIPLARISAVEVERRGGRLGTTVVRMTDTAGETLEFEAKFEEANEFRDAVFEQLG